MDHGLESTQKKKTDVAGFHEQAGNEPRYKSTAWHDVSWKHIAQIKGIAA